MGMMPNSGWGWGMGFMSPILTLIIIGGIIFLIIYLLNNSKDKSSSSSVDSHDRSLDILNERYARGEIDDEEYERRRRILSR
jgi:putative membrane protein